MTNATQRRLASEERRHNPEIREKIATILETCDEALEGAAEMLQAAEAMLAKYAVYNDEAYENNLYDIRQITYSLAKVVAFRKTLDKNEYISKLAAGRLGAEIQRLGDDFNP
jgi:ferric iron reductase protein FhuF